MFFFIFLLFGKKLLCSIISRILNSYAIIDFFILVTEIAAEDYGGSIYNRCCLSSHMHMPSGKNSSMLSNATGCPDFSENLHWGFFNMLNPHFQSNVLSDNSRNTSFKIYFLSNQEGVTLKCWQNTNNLMYSHLNVHVC